MSETTDARIRSDRSGLLIPLADARFLAALALLIANDHVFKAAFGNWVTGKLSDVAGLIVLPVIAAVALRAARVRRPMAVGFGGVAIWFAAMKTVPAVARGTERLAEAVTGTSSSIVVDPSDLLGLAGLAVAALIVRNPRPLMTSRMLKGSVLAVGLLACTATSNDGGTPHDLAIDPETGEVSWSEYSEISSVEDEGVESSSPLIGENEFATQACLAPGDGGDCFRIEGGRVERQNGSGDWGTEWALFDHGVILRQVGAGAGYSPTLKATDIVVSGDGEVHVAFSGVRPIMRDTDGVWSPPASTYRPIGSMLAVVILGLGGLALAVLRRRVKFVVAAAIFAGLGLFALSPPTDLLNVVPTGGVIAALIAFIIGAAEASGFSGRFGRRRVALALGGVLIGVALTLVWKYVVSAPSGLFSVAPVVAVTGVVAALALHPPLPPAPTAATPATAAGEDHHS